MPSRKRTLDEPAVRAVLSGVKRGSKFYYRVDPVTGVPMAFPARAELMKLAGMSQATGSRLLREAVSAGLITKENIDPAQESQGTSESQVGTCDTRAAEKEADDVASNATHDDEEQDESGSRTTSKLPLGLGDIPKGELNRYELVKTGSGFWGYWDREQQREVILSRDKELVLEEIYALRRSANKSPFAWPTEHSPS